MNHTQHKFLTTAIVFVIMVIGVFIASQFREISLGALNIGLLLVNALLLLIILGILLQMNENVAGSKKRAGKNA
ncbi:hypothetical protein HYX08_01465 [Candidatus Woesearchaeota archaeon]|nr:hypothetical protein [Candidatus Woesearchaeota archaeon]